MGFSSLETHSRVVDREKEAYLVRNKNPSVIGILNDENSSKCSLDVATAATKFPAIRTAERILIGGKFSPSPIRLQSIHTLNKNISAEPYRNPLWKSPAQLDEFDVYGKTDTASSRRSRFLLIFVTPCDAQIWPNKCNQNTLHIYHFLESCECAFVTHMARTWCSQST